MPNPLMSQLTKTARVFTGPNASGNACVVHRCATVPSDDISHFSSRYTQCFSWQCAEQITVACFTANGHPIVCCGHGLMATAAFWHSDTVFQRPFTLLMNGSEISCCITAQGIELGFNRITCRFIDDLPGWMRQFFSNKPCCFALAGGEDGYMICEWPPGYDLRSLPLPGQALQQVSQRAMIVTCLESESHSQQSEHSSKIQFRYFAPQYETSEDDATGSALRVLADYWQQKHSIRLLKAYQCSSAGGLLYSRIEDNTIFIGGAVQWL